MSRAEAEEVVHGVVYDRSRKAMARNWPQFIQQAHAGVTQRHAAGHAVQQAYLETFLKLTCRVAEGRGCHTEPRHGSSNAELVRNCG
jgi:hypothetical protein